MDVLPLVMLILMLSMPLWTMAAVESPLLLVPPLLLLQEWHAGLSVDAYLVSEKYDGVRVWWSGEVLLTRSGAAIAAPLSLLARLPAGIPLDGELWAGRGRFDLVSGLVRSRTPESPDWDVVRLMLFDLPASPDPLESRLAQLQLLMPDDDRVSVVPQRRLTSDLALQQYLQAVVDGGGEGLVLRRQGSLYLPGRHDAWLKLKPWQDDEARVIELIPGKGKYTGLTGSLLVERADGRRFRVGSGLSDAQRRQPPAPGSLITYRFSGYTSGGLPRFPRFLRERLPE